MYVLIPSSQQPKALKWEYAGGAPQGVLRLTSENSDFTEAVVDRGGGDTAGFESPPPEGRDPVYLWNPLLEHRTFFCPLFVPNIDSCLSAVFSIGP